VKDKTKTFKRPLRVVFFCVLCISAVLVLNNFWEWYSVEKLNNTDGYNFGDTINRAYYYQSKALYAFIHLFWGSCFTVSLVLMLVSFLFKARWYKAVSLALSLLITGVYIFHEFLV